MDIGLSNIFMDAPSQAKKTKAKINYWDHTKIKIKKTINKTKRQINDWEKIFASDIYDKWLIPKILKNFYNSTPKNNPTKNGQKTM